VGWNLLGDGLHSQLILHEVRRPARSWLGWIRLGLRSRWGVVAGALVAGLVIGLALGWAVQPTPPGGIRPSQLRQSYREDYLRAVIGSYSSNHNPGLALTRFQALGEFAESTLEAVRIRPRSVTFASVREFLGVIEPFRRTSDILGPSITRTADFLAAYCITGVVAVVSVAAIVSVAKRSLRPRRRARLTPSVARRARKKGDAHPP
jgi:hypothetical protein